MSQKKTSREDNQKFVENSLGLLASSMLSLKHVQLRLNQAIRRKPEMEDLLMPAVNDVFRILNQIDQAQDEFSTFWEKGQNNGWWE